MAKTISNKKAKDYSKITDTFKQCQKSATIQGVAIGYRALSKMIIERINQGYTLEQIKTFCENVDREYKEKSKEK